MVEVGDAEAGGGDHVPAPQRAKVKHLLRHVIVDEGELYRPKNGTVAVLLY